MTYIFAASSKIKINYFVPISYYSSNIAMCSIFYEDSSLQKCDTLFLVNNL